MHCWSLIKDQKLICFLQEAQMRLKTPQRKKANNTDTTCVALPQAERPSELQVTVNNILGRAVRYPSSISRIRDHCHALQALFLGPSAEWWDEEEHIRLSPERHWMDRAVEQGNPCCPQSSPGRAVGKQSTEQLQTLPAGYVTAVPRSSLLRFKSPCSSSSPSWL